MKKKGAIMSNKKESIYNKLYKVQKEVGAISKSKQNKR